MGANLWFVINVGLSGSHCSVGDDGLTAVQRQIRDSNGQAPKYIKRSIDEHRQLLGMVPLWGFSQCSASEHCRRTQNRNAQRRRRAKNKGGQDGR